MPGSSLLLSVHYTLPACILDVPAVMRCNLTQENVQPIGLAGMGGRCAYQATAISELPGRWAHTSCRN